MAELAVSHSGRPRYRPMSGHALHGNKSGTAEVNAFVSYGGKVFFIFSKKHISI